MPTGRPPEVEHPQVAAQTAVDAMTTGRRYGGGSALTAGLVDAVGQADAIAQAGTELVRPLVGKDRATLGAIKSTMFADVVASLQGDAG